ncbi:MAG: transposase [Deltaproteobacteria bacterium]|nr:transposase [Deltaproteobacteria bacterium]
MPGALSQDLRKRVVDAYDNGEGSYVQLAERFGIGVATVKRWMWRRRDTGGLEPLFSNNGNKPVFTTPENLELLRQILLQEPDLTYEELAAAWSGASGMEIGRTTTVNAVRKLGFSLKKKPSARSNATSRGSKASNGASSAGSKV